MRKWIVTFFGSGMSPVAPGTMGSLLASLILLAAYALGGATYYTPFLIVGLIGASALSITLGPWAIQHYGRKDPQSFVLDEVAGICLTNLFLPITPGWHQAWTIGIAFLAFRIFDVTKPPPARQLEHLPGGWGILLDDLAAAVYANILCQLLFHYALRRLV